MAFGVRAAEEVSLFPLPFLFLHQSLMLFVSPVAEHLLGWLLFRGSGQRAQKKEVHVGEGGK